MTRRGVELLALTFAAVWSVGLLVAAITVPVYQGTTETSVGGSTEVSDTLVGANGSGVLIVVAVPLAVTVLVASLLLLGASWGPPVAFVLTGILGLLNLLAMLSIGIFMLPVTGALLLACVLAVTASRPAPDLVS